MKKFPQVVQLHQKYAEQGLVVLSFDVEPSEREQREEVLKFLREQKADFTNFIANDSYDNIDNWMVAHNAATPSYVVFNRAGKLVSTPYPADLNDMEKFVAKLLAE